MVVEPKSKSVLDRLQAMLDGTYEPPPPPAVDPETVDLYGGISGLRVESEAGYEIAPGLTVRPTYAHIFSHFMGAFARPKLPTAPHPSPWVALRGGGVAFDVDAEVHLATDVRCGELSRLNSLWLFTAIVRLLSGAEVHMPAISTASYASIPTADTEPVLWAMETRPPSGRWNVVFDDEFAQGVRTGLSNAATLLANEEFNRAFQTLDGVTWLPSNAAKLVAIWTAMETAMRPGRQQITKKLARALGNYIGKNRAEQDRICNRVIDLYLARGSFAHDARLPELQAVRESYLIARSMFIRIIASGQMPQQDHQRA